MRDHSDDIPAELARLADGTLAPKRRAALEARVARSPELQALLAEQQRVRAAIDEVAEPAPAGLRARIEALRPERGRRARIALVGALATAAAALTLALALPGGSPAGPSLSKAATLTALPATAPAPGRRADTLLNIAIGGVWFPEWREAFGWRATGARTDTLDGRDATTVFYEKAGSRIGYTIVAGDALAIPDTARHKVNQGLRLHTLTAGGRTIVTWERMGHTCILSGKGVAVEKLIDLAAWTAGGTVRY